MYEAFRQGLQRLGWIDGRNVQIDVRFGAGVSVRIRKYAAELITLSPDVMLASGGSTTQLMLQETRTVPIIFTIVPDRSALASSKACRNRAETRRVSCSSNTA